MGFDTQLTLPTLILLTLGIFANFSFATKLSSEFGSDLQSLLDNALPGDTIELLPIDYIGDFVLPDKGLSGRITLKGSNSDTKSTRILGSETALTISGGSWCICNLSIGSGQRGIEVKGSNHEFKSLSINGVIQALILQGDSNKVQSLSINGGDEGITVQGNRNQLLHISCSGQRSFAVNVTSGLGTTIRSLSVNRAQKYALILAQDSCCGGMNSLSLDGLLEVRGRSYEFRSLSSSGAVNVFGCSNVFSSSSIQQVFVTRACQNSFSRSNWIQRWNKSPTIPN